MNFRNIVYLGLFLYGLISVGNAEIVEKYGRQFEKEETNTGDVYTEVGSLYNAKVTTKKGNKINLENITFFKEYWHGGGKWFEGYFYCKSIDVMINETKFTIPFEKIKKIDFFWRGVLSDSAVIYLKNDKEIKVKKVGLFWEYNRDFRVVGEVYNEDLETKAKFNKPDYTIKSIELEQKD